MLALTGCGTGDAKDEPQINLQFNVSDLTDEEFQSVGTKGLENAAKSDFKNIEFSLDIEQSNKISDRKVIIPNLREAANAYDIERYWSGESYNQDNTGEKFAEYGAQFVFYSKGLDEQTIKKIFDSSEVNVSWTANNRENEEKVIRLGEVIQFK
ncbi:MAG: hypothetical protein U9N81_06955 [Bacillota bacterium]|nr:hypothetical protein [Bacillota bacterium]